MRFGGTDVGPASTECVATKVRKITTVCVGVVVEEHRNRVRLRPPFPERARVLAGLRLLGVRAAERDERHDIERAEIRMHAVVARDRDVLGDGVGQIAGGGARVVRSGAGQGEHRTVVIGVDVHVDQ